MKRLPIIIVLGMMAVGLAIGVWGIRKNLPYVQEVDESIFVANAVRMASTGNMNPEWFGNPGLTTVYPITLGSHIWYAATQNGDLLNSNPKLQTHFNEHINDYYIIGRLLSVLYAVLTLPLTYLLGKRAFNQRTALIGTFFLLTYTIFWIYAQWARTDLAAAFWSMLSLWLCVRAYERPSWQRYVLAGLAIGLSIASRYFMVTLAPVLFIVWATQFWRSRHESQHWIQLRNGVLGLLAIAVGFTLIAPYLFLEFSTTVENVLNEARSEHLGADGLSQWGNFWWYITVAFPLSISWPQVILAFFGIGLAVARRKAERLLLAAFIFIFLFAISLSPLHWPRWVLQLLPLLALFTASALDATADYAARRLHWSPKTETISLFLLVVLISILPINTLSQAKLSQSSPTTRVMARQWIIENIPAGSKIGQEWYTAPL